MKQSTSQSSICQRKHQIWSKSYLIPIALRRAFEANLSHELKFFDFFIFTLQCISRVFLLYSKLTINTKNKSICKSFVSKLTVLVFVTNLPMMRRTDSQSKRNPISLKRITQSTQKFCGRGALGCCARNFRTVSAVCLLYTFNNFFDEPRTKFKQNCNVCFMSVVNIFLAV